MKTRLTHLRTLSFDLACLLAILGFFFLCLWTTLPFWVVGVMWLTAGMLVAVSVASPSPTKQKAV